MSAALMVAGVMWVALVVYALTGGADFGGGMWDLWARGQRAKAQRALIADAIGPIWEANHVWLILVIVLMFVGFPKAFAAISIDLHIPLTLMLIGIVLRGSAFVFRAYDDKADDIQRRWSLIFSVSSLLTPWMLGISLGAVVSGSLQIDQKTGMVKTDFVSSWLAPFPMALGFLIVALFAFLAAVYLILETEDRELQEDFRLRALGAGIAVGGWAFVCLFLARSGASYLLEALSQRWWSWPFQIGTGAVALGALWALWRRAYRLARLLAMAQVVFLMAGWALAQYPYLLRPDLLIEAAAAPESVLRSALWVLGLGSFLLLPSFWYLFRLFKAQR